MYVLTQKLLAGSPVSVGSHPVLISLLELAAQPALLDREGFPDSTSWCAFRQRVRRTWTKVRLAFKAACLAGITDEKVIAALPYAGLSFSWEEGWKISQFDPGNYRLRVAALIEKAAGVETGTRKLSRDEMARLVRAFGRCICAERALRAVLKQCGYKNFSLGVHAQVKALCKTRNEIRRGIR